MNFDGANCKIIIPSDTDTVCVQTELYSAWKIRARKGNMGLPQAFMESTGGAISFYGEVAQSQYILADQWSIELDQNDEKEVQILRALRRSKWN